VSAADTPGVAVLAGVAQTAFESAVEALDHLRDLDGAFAGDLAVRWIAALAVGFVRVEEDDR
jgi:hypothetical protein